MHYGINSQPISTYNKSMNSYLICTVLVLFNEVSSSGSNKLLGLLLFSYLTKLHVENTITQVSHPTFPTKPHASPSILTNTLQIPTISISINVPLLPPSTWLIGLLLFQSFINLHHSITSTIFPK